MQYTSTYQLNQWEKTDRVLRTDFNNDNQKIEEALMNVARYIKLKEITTEQAVTDGIVEIDVSDIDFAAWQYVHVDVQPKGGSQVNIRINNQSGNCNYAYPANGYSAAGNGLMGYITGNSSDYYAERITFMPGRLGNRRIDCRIRRIYGWCTVVNFSDFEKLVFAGSLQAGTKFIIWGEA